MSLDVGASTGDDRITLQSTIARLSELVESYVARRDENLTLDAETAVQSKEFVQALQIVRNTLQTLSDEGVNAFAVTLQSFETGLDNFLRIPSGMPIGSILVAYRLALAPYVLYAASQNQISRAVADSKSALEASAIHYIDNMKATAAQAARVANDAADQLDAKTDHLANKLLDELKLSGESVIASIRADVSEQVLRNAQNEFSAAQVRAARDVRIWSLITVVVGVGFAWFGWHLLASQEQLFTIHPNWTWQFIYIGGLRAALLAAIAALGSFGLRMLKHHIHISHTVAYKSRILKSVPGLLVASPVDNRYSTLQLVIAALLSERELVVEDNNPEALSLAVPRLEAKPASRREGSA
jgi:hypothetical protein